jgi:alpha-2-macroglobulin
MEINWEDKEKFTNLIFKKPEEEIKKNEFVQNEEEPPVYFKKIDGFPSKQDTEEKKYFLEEKELKIIHKSPTGLNINKHDSIFITFNQDMIKFEDLDLVPEMNINILPSTKGIYSWVDTKMLKFTPNEPFQNSIRYRVIVPKGITSFSKSSLQEDVVFEFSTPTPNLEFLFPNKVESYNKPLFICKFDQEVDKKYFFDSIKLLDNSYLQWNTYNFVSLGLDEFTIEMKKNVYQNLQSQYQILLDQYDEKNTFLFTTKSNLSSEYIYTLTVLSGVQKKGIFLPSTSKYEFKFTIWGTFKPSKKTFKFSSNTNWKIEMTTPISLETAKESMIKITPSIKSMNVSFEKNFINITGLTKGKFSYNLSISNELCDIFGQNISKENSEIKIDIDPLTQRLISFKEGIIIRDPFEEIPTYRFITCNIHTVHITIYQVDPFKDLEISQFGRNQSITKTIDLDFGKKVYDNEIEVKNYKDNEFIESKISLSNYLKFPKKELGHLIIFVEPIMDNWNSKWESRPILSNWYQSTELSIETFVNSTEVVCWSNNLKNGSSIKENIDFYFKTNDSTKQITTSENFAIFNFEKTETNIVMIKSNDDVTFITDIYTKLDNSSIKPYVFHNKNYYLENDEVYLKGYIRHIGKKDSKNIFDNPLDESKVQIEVFDSNQMLFFKKEESIKELGSFDTKFVINKDVSTGICKVVFKYENIVFHDELEVYKIKPKYEIILKSDKKDYFINSIANINIKIKDFDSDLIQNHVTFKSYQKRCKFTPPNWNKYIFQNIVENNEINLLNKPDCNPIFIDYDGNYNLELKLNYIHKTKEITPIQYKIESFFKNKFINTTSFIVHPSNLYVGIKCLRSIFQIDEKIPFFAIVTDIKGLPIENINITYQIFKRNKDKSNYEMYFEEELISSNEPIKAKKNDLNEPGMYLITCSIIDQNGLINKVSKNICIIDIKENNQNDLFIYSDKPEYEIGDLAIIFVQSTKKSCETLQLTMTNKLIEKEIAHIEGLKTIRMIINKTHIPKLNFFFNSISSCDNMLPYENINLFSIDVLMNKFELKSTITTSTYNLFAGEVNHF